MKVYAIKQSKLTGIKHEISNPEIRGCGGGGDRRPALPLDRFLSFYVLNVRFQVATSFNFNTRIPSSRNLEKMSAIFRL